MNVRHFLIAVLLLASPLSYGGGASTGILPVEIETPSHVYLVRAELAVTAEQRARGLMARDTLAADGGMLFLYDHPQPGHRGFWMYRTRIPLDIAFLDADGRIVSLFTMQPCSDEMAVRCPAYVPAVTYFAALEVNGGYFARKGIKTGDRVIFNRPDRRSMPGPRSR